MQLEKAPQKIVVAICLLLWSAGCLAQDMSQAEHNGLWLRDAFQFEARMVNENNSTWWYDGSDESFQNFVAKSDNTAEAVGYTEGLVDVLADLQGKLQGKEAKGVACFPTLLIPYAEIHSVILSYLDKHPTKLHEPAYKVILGALRDAYPCDPLSTNKR